MDKILQGVLILLAILSILLAVLYFMGLIVNSYAVILAAVVAIVVGANCCISRRNKE